MFDFEIERLKRGIYHVNVTVINSTPCLVAVSDWRVESPIVKENAHHQKVLVEQQTVDKQQQDNVKNLIYNCLVEIIQEDVTGGHAIYTN